MKATEHSIDRREALAMATLCLSMLPTLGCNSTQDDEANGGDSSAENNAKKNDSDKIKENEKTKQGAPMKVQYLEIVTKEVDALCKSFTEIHGVTFGEADQSLGGARTAKMTDGAMLGIRAPMHDGENAVTRPYMLVENIEKAVESAKSAGAEIAVPPMKLPGHGTCAIYIQGGIEVALWQN